MTEYKVYAKPEEGPIFIETIYQCQIADNYHSGAGSKWERSDGYVRKDGLDAVANAFYQHMSEKNKWERYCKRVAAYGKFEREEDYPDPDAEESSEEIQAFIDRYKILAIEEV